MQDRFKQLLSDKHLTAARFASVIKVNASAISHILNGRSKPGFDILDKIARAYPDINLNWLISGKGSAYNKETAITENRSKDFVQPDLFSREKTDLPEDKASSASVFPADMEEMIPTDTPIPVSAGKKIKRIILFFENGSFENYEQ